MTRRHDAKTPGAVRRAVRHTAAAALVPLLGLALGLGLAGCASTSRVHDATQPVALPTAFRSTGEATVEARWWTAFQDDGLNQLEASALDDNFTLRSAWERLRQAAAASRIAGAATQPTLSASGDAGRSRSISESRTTNSASLGLGLSAGYEVDLWGGVAARITAAERSEAASAADLHTAALTLSAEVADTWYRVLTGRARLASLQQLRDTNATQLSVLEQRYDLGRAEGSDVLQQRRLLTGTDAAIAALHGEVASAEIHLAALLGQVPSLATLPDATALPDLPPLPASGVPGEVLLQRPDVRAAWLRLQAADQSYAAAMTDRLPALRLTAGASTGGSAARDLFRTNLLSLAGELAVPVLDGGRLKATADQGRARADEAYWAFAGTLVDAAEEVEAALAAEQHQSEYLAQLRLQLGHARQAADALRLRYYQGTDNFTSYLQAVTTAQDLETTVIAAEGTLLRNRVAVYRALAGDLPLAEPARLPSRVDPIFPGRTAAAPAPTTTATAAAESPAGAPANASQTPSPETVR